MVGRIEQQNILKEIPGPTAYVKQAVDHGSVRSAFRLLIDDPLLRHIRDCTVAEAHQQLQNNLWSLSVEELEAFIAIVYARGAYGAKNLSISSLWSTSWGPPFFRETKARNRFVEIMKYLGFDKKDTRRQCLETDKFALASEPWNKLINNSILCYKPGENIAIDELFFSNKS